MYTEFSHPRTGGLPAAVPQGVRVYAIGDVHGMDDLLAEVHEEIKTDLADRPVASPHIIHVGDYEDRGPKSKQVIDRLIGLQIPPARVHCLKGNHEAEFLGFLDDPEYWGPHWMRYGGEETIRSYGIEPRSYGQHAAGLQRLRDDLMLRIPPDHIAFLRSRPLSLTVGDYFFCHAGIRPGIPFADQVEDDLTWIRDEFLDSDLDFGKVVVHGHTPGQRPDVRPNRINIDTTAFHSEILTCLVLEGTSLRFL